MNKAILSGRICSDIELRQTSTQVSVCSFRVAVQRRFKNAEGNYDADFISCQAWRSNADFISKYFKKGDPINVVGSIQTRSYEKDGQTVYVTEVIVEEPGFVPKSKTENNTSDNSEKSTPSANIPSNDIFNTPPEGFMPAVADEDLPF